MLPLGTELPHFRLEDVRTREEVSSKEFDQPALLVMFICNHCPYVKLIQPGLVALGRDYQERPLAILAVASNDALLYPEDGPDELARVAGELGHQFPVLYDETQEVARAFTAACTPDFFLFDADRRLAYRGQFDDARPGNGRAVTGASLREAIEAILAGEPAPREQRPSMGCSIKWRAEGIAIR
jgi:hypothetical protein